MAEDRIRPESSTDRRRLAWGGAILLSWFVLTFRFSTHTLGPPGIETGWRWGLNHAAVAGLDFGRDLVFTFGPLGYLLYPLDLGWNLIWSALFLVLLQLLLGAVAGDVLVRGRRTAGVVAFVVLWAAAARVGLTIEPYAMLAAAAMAALVAVDRRRWALATLSALAGLYVFVKITLGITALFMLVVAAVLAWRRDRGRTIPLLALVPGAVVAVVLALWHFPSIAVLVRWLGLSLEMVDGYAAAMSILGPMANVGVGLALVAVLLAIAVTASTDRRHLMVALVFSLPLAVVFRLAFIRQDSHQYQFVPFVVGLLALSALAARGRRAVVLHLAGGLVAVIAGAAVGILPVPLASLPAAVVTGHPGPADLARLLQLGGTRKALAEASAPQLAPLGLPPEWVEMARRSPNGVGTLPWENLYCPANGLEWNPTPTMQLYTAFTARLDSWCAERYRGDRAPGFILNDYKAMGKRHQVLDAPATFQELFLSYRPIAVHPTGEPLLLLERRPQRLEVKRSELGEAVLELDGPGLNVPNRNRMVFAEIELEPNLNGRWRNGLFRVPLLMALFHRASGVVTYYRLIPSTATNGILVSRFPRDLVGYHRLWAGRCQDPVVRLQITGAGTRCFEPEARVRWYALDPVQPDSDSDPDPDPALTP